MASVEVSIIVPTLNEAANIPELTRRISATMSGRTYELLIVDDNSRDNTPEICNQLSQTNPLQLLVRTTPKDGLSGAVLYGAKQARGTYLVVMDADLQHPPEKIPELLEIIERNEADFVIGSRYVKGGSIAGKWNVYRQLNSHIATLLARPFAGQIKDPMSGFFALRHSDYLDARRLTPLGYKIALELLVKTRAKRVKEIPITFAQRMAGESKLNLKQQFKYLEHLSRLYDYSHPRIVPILKFLFVTLLSWACAISYHLSLIELGWTTQRSIAFSYLWVIAMTAVFHARYVRTQHEFLARQSPWRDFIISAVGELATCAIVAWYLLWRAPTAYHLEILLISFSAATFTRYLMRKELLLDVRGLRHEVRKDDLMMS